MFDDLLAANKDYARDFSLEGLPGRAAKGFALVTCMDTRVDPLPILGLQPGDAKIIRNAGGRVTDDALRSLALAVAYLGVTEIAVMQHSRCALAGQSEGQAHEGLPAAAADVELLAMPDPDAALEADVIKVRRSPLIPEGAATVQGWRYDVDSGWVKVIVG